MQFPEQGYHCTRGNKGQLSAGRKHQLRKACANVLHAPILGDGRYALLRSPEQLWFQERLQELPAVPEDRPEEALSSMLQCNRHLQLHCFQVILVSFSIYLSITQYLGLNLFCIPAYLQGADCNIWANNDTQQTMCFLQMYKFV